MAMNPDHQPRCTYCDDRGCSECRDINDAVECPCCDGSGCPECIPDLEEEMQIRAAEEAEEQKRIDEAIEAQEEWERQNAVEPWHED
jgi:hypothetical protein